MLKSFAVILLSKAVTKTGLLIGCKLTRVLFLAVAFCKNILATSMEISVPWRPEGYRQELYVLLGLFP